MMMKVNKFVETLKEIEKQPTVYYSVAGGAWCAWNGKSWNMDCVCMIKGVLWGFDFNKQAPHGGAIYGSNGVYDDDANQIMNRCYDISRNFNDIKFGEIMHMDGHVGVYIGNRKVVEATAWFDKVIISTVETDGRRTKDGLSGGYWKEHGKIKYVDYIEEKPSKTIEELAQEVIAGKWGNNPERKRRLIEAGYDYAKVQARVNEIMAGYKPGISYYPTFNNVSIIDGLISIGVDSSFENRTRIANANGIKDYVGSYEQNVRLLQLAREGKLIRA